jgi:hypothetical protein
MNIPIMPIAICTILVGVRVVHEGATLLHLEFVDEGLPRLDLPLR